MVCIVFGITTCLLFANTLGAWPEGPPAYRTGAIGDKGTCHAAFKIEVIIKQLRTNSLA